MYEQYNILYVDDESSNLNSFKLLYRRDYNIFSAESGQQGLDILKKNEIHLIITDQKMPNMSGIEFLKKVKNKWPKPKIILLTGFTDNEAVKEAINEVGIFWYVNKPFDPDAMGHIIKSTLKTYQIERDKEVIDIELQQSRERIRKLLHTTFEGFITINEEHEITMVNPAVSKMFGYKEKELLGESINILIPEYVKGHSQLIKKYADSNGQARLISGSFGRRKNGESVPVETSISKMVLGGKKYYNAVIRDVSQRLKNEARIKESEEEFKGVFNSMIDVFSRSDLKGKCVMISPSIFDMIGYKDEEIIGKKLSMIYDKPKDRELLLQKLKENGSIQNFEEEIVKKNGDKITISCNSKMYFDDKGKPIGVDSIFRDITVRKKAEEKIQQMNEELELKVQQRTSELEKANKDLKIADQEISEALAKEKELGDLKSRFVSTASHQFRTPLTVIHSNIELLEHHVTALEENSKNKFDKSFYRIKKETVRMTQLMDDVLIVGKINAGAIQPSFQWIDLARLGRELADRLNEVSDMTAKIKLKVEGQSKDIWLDEKLVSHTLLNLLHNAQKYSLNRGDVDFTMTFSDHLKIQIHDRGIGISEEDLKNIFQPFHRGKNALHIPGTGLGMAIVHEYVLLNEGEINIQSELNEGTDVSIIFPYKTKKSK